MEYRVYSALELDAIGEVMNISLGSSATAVSNMLNHRVDISTPVATAVPVEEFSLGEMEPAVCVEIQYVAGLRGSNIMMLKKDDVRVIVDILMGAETEPEEFELNELSISAVCEVMNQMMGAASTALSDFLGKSVNISTPTSFMLEDLENFKKEHIDSLSGTVVVVRFNLKIEDKLDSEFINVIPVELVDDMLAGFGMDPTPQTATAQEVQASGAGSDQAAAAQPQAAPTAQQQAAPPPQMPAQPAPMQDPGMPQMPVQGMPMQDPNMPQMPVQGMPMQDPNMPQMQYAPPPQMMYAPQPGAYPMPPQYMGQVMYQQDPKVISTQPAELPVLSQSDRLPAEQATNLDLILSVPLEVSVEIGRTRRKVEEILTFSKGSLVVLDKLAGDQVDLYVNGLCIAKGDVVVINDNFGVRITEVLTQSQLLEATNAK